MADPTKTTPPNSPRTIRDIFNELFEALKEWFEPFFDLQEGSDREGTIIAIKNNKRMYGANAWLLMCSIMIASLGLDLNSPAVIIGAMLISPLMSPILGVGLAVGINDKEALYLSLKHFGIAIVIALVTSILYFSITPFGEPTNEILTRTKPTLLDGLVAVFGGLAGIISTTRKDISNAIPGVAIATALMPPLCVSGFFFAQFDWANALNAFYLFFLNSFFIALTAYIIIRLLRFPLKEHLNHKEASRTRWIIVFFSLILIIPSGIILFDLLKEQRLDNRIKTFVEDNFNSNSQTSYLDYQLILGDTSNQLVLRLLGQTIPEDSFAIYNQKLLDYDIENTRINFIQDADLGLDEIHRMRLEITSLNDFAQKLEQVNKTKTDQELKIIQLQSQLDSLKKDSIPFSKICLEAKTVFPKLNNIAFAKAQKNDFSHPIQEIPLFLIKWEARKSRAERRRDEEKLKAFLKISANLDTLQLISY